MKKSLRSAKKHPPFIRMKPIDEMINTEYGLINYESWCKKEAERIGGKAHVVYLRGNVGVKI